MMEINDVNFNEKISNHNDDEDGASCDNEDVGPSTLKKKSLFTMSRVLFFRFFFILHKSVDVLMCVFAFSRRISMSTQDHSCRAMERTL